KALAVNLAQVFEIGSVGELVLCQREEWFAFTVRFAHSRNNEASRIGAAKINAALGNGINDLAGEAMQPFAVPIVELLINAEHFRNRRPNDRSQRGRNGVVTIRGEIGEPPAGSLEPFEQIGRRLPVVDSDRIKEAPK